MLQTFHCVKKKPIFLAPFTDIRNRLESHRQGARVLLARALLVSQLRMLERRVRPDAWDQTLSLEIDAVSSALDSLEGRAA